MTLPAGTRLGSFEVLAPLGAGGMGEVYRARDLRLGREVALKVLPEELSQDAGRLARFEQEARSASALNHPNIVTIHEIGREGDTPYIAMELVDGKTLRELSASGPMPTRKILAAAAQVAEGLAKAHGAGIVHRDLKPENLMVSRDGFVKILDFGLAKLTEPETGGVSAMPTLGKPETHPGTVLGTVGYMSPEQASGQTVDFRSDQFSLGSILYELVTGEKAFARKTAAETMSAIIREDPEPLGRLKPLTPLPLRWIVERCLAKDPEERYASTRDLARDLVGVRDHVSEIGSGGEALMASPARSRARMLQAVSAAVLLLAGLSGGWLASRGSRQTRPPAFHRLTFRQGGIHNARFAPDGQTIVYGANWGPGRESTLYQTRPESPESRAFDFKDADIFAISPAGEMAVRIEQSTLARVPLTGGVPRPVLKGVWYASVDWSPDGKEFAVIRAAGGLNRLESPIGKVLFETTGSLSSPRFSPKGDEIAIFNTEGSVSIVLVETSGKGHRSLSTGWTDFAGVPCWTPDGREVWFTATKNEEKPALHAVDRSGHERLVIRVPGDLELDDISAQGRLLLAHHTQTYRLVGRAPGESQDRDLSWLDNSFPWDLSEDGTKLVFSEIGDGGGKTGSVYMRGTDGSPAVRLGDGRGGPLSPDGQWVASVVRAGKSAAPTVILLPTGAGQTRPVSTPGFEDIGAVAWMPDGKKLLIDLKQRDRPWRVHLVDLASQSLRPVAEDGVMILTPVSPDGRLFVGRGKDGVTALYSTEGGQPRPIPGLQQQEFPRQWTADGKSLYVFHFGTPVGHILLLNIETGDKRLWRELHREGMGGTRMVRINRAGDSYAFLVAAALSELYIVDGLR